MSNEILRLPAICRKLNFYNASLISILNKTDKCCIRINGAIARFINSRYINKPGVSLRAIAVFALQAKSPSADLRFAILAKGQ
ncbi:hypothetical protein [Saccharicrinis sp. FJH54]|uniref:hypothetical protein n=1 Tax=Saccharicrinis sp. FJH54 TaxID=3344665 RepID=UPI0035D46F28